MRALIALLFFLTLAAPAEAQTGRIKVLLDTDIGTDIDDAWALGLLMVSPRVELVGVTICDGNTPARAKVAVKLLHAGGLHMLLADAMALQFSRPLFMIPLALLFLGELAGWRRTAVTLAGFCGIVIPE